ncbi:MAG: PIN domain-containing protein [Myxococcales bacterium]|nr:PIN domain-containing protein [Myxococcales bacterium]
MNDGITFDTGALIALERRSLFARKILERALERKMRITVPAVVLTEWWRGRSDVREVILAAVRVEPLAAAVAKLAGEALTSVRGGTAVDAIVVASAAQRGDVVYTSDVEDLAKLAAHFRSVRVLGIG